MAVVSEMDEPLNCNAENEPDVSQTFTLEEAIDSIGYGWFQGRLLLVAGFTFMADAMEMVLISFIAKFAQDDLNADSLVTSIISSMVFLGMLIGAFTWGLISDRYGRRPAFYGCIVVTFAFGLLSAGSMTAVMLGLCRMWVGFGTAGTHAAVTLYMEFVPVSMRGSMLVLVQSFWSVGVVLECFIAWATSDMHWRYLLIFSSIPLGLLSLCYPIIPESVRWLQLHHQDERAMEILRSAAALNRKPLPIGILQPLSHVSKPTEGFSSQIRALWAPSLRLQTGLLFIIWLTSAGVYYGIILLTEQVFQKNSNLYVDVLIASVWEVPGYAVCLLMIKYMSRKRACAVCMTLAGLGVLCMPMQFFSSTEALEILITGWTRLWIVCVFTLIWVYTPEAFPTSVRSTAFGTCSSIARVAGMGTPFIAIQGHQASPWIPAIVYSLGCFISATAAVNLPVETKGRRLQEEVDWEPAAKGVPVEPDGEELVAL